MIIDLLIMGAVCGVVGYLAGFLHGEEPTSNELATFTCSASATYHHCKNCGHLVRCDKED
jgi:hypothetical protein